MAKANYRQIPSLLSEHKPFKGNSMSAEIVQTELSDPIYIVKSYRTTILIKNLATGDITFDETKYSATTSRHQNLIRANVKGF